MPEHDETPLSRDRKNKTWREQTVNRARSLEKGGVGTGRLSEQRTGGQAARVGMGVGVHEAGS